MRTQWTAKGNRDAGSSCLCNRGLHRYLRNFGGGGLNTLNPPSVRHCRPGFPITDGSQYYPAGHEIFHCCWSPIFVRTYHICKSTPLERVASSWTFHSPFLQIPDLLSLFRQNSGFQIRLFPWALRRNLYRCRFPCEHCVKSISSFSTDPNEEKALNMGAESFSEMSEQTPYTLHCHLRNAHLNSLNICVISLF